MAPRSPKTKKAPGKSAGKKTKAAAPKRASGSTRSKSVSMNAEDLARAISANVVATLQTEKPETAEEKAAKIKAAEKAMAAKVAEARLNQINEIIKGARATWFALLGALVFAAVTLAGVKDEAFFLPDVETKLPIANISVPVFSFF